MIFRTGNVKNILGQFAYVDSQSARILNSVDKNLLAVAANKPSITIFHDIKLKDDEISPQVYQQ